MSETETHERNQEGRAESSEERDYRARVSSHDKANCERALNVHNYASTEPHSVAWRKSRHERAWLNVELAASRMREALRTMAPTVIAMAHLQAAADMLREALDAASFCPLENAFLPPHELPPSRAAEVNLAVNLGELTDASFANTKQGIDAAIGNGFGVDRAVEGSARG